MYIVASPDPNPRGGGQLPNLTECNSTLTSATRGETLTPNPKSAILRYIIKILVSIPPVCKIHLQNGQF